MLQKHVTWIKDKNSTSKKQLYQQARQRVQSKLRQMKNNWWVQNFKMLLIGKTPSVSMTT